MKIQWAIKALKQLRKLPKQDGQRIYQAVQSLLYFPQSLKNIDVKALRNNKYSYRLRIGRYRVLFDFDTELKIISIEEVKKRDEQTY